MIQYRASWKRLMPQEWIREGLWVIPWMLHLCEGTKPQGKAELYAVPIGLLQKGLGEKWASGCGSVLTWVLGLQISADLWLCPAEQLLAHELRGPDLRDKRMVAEVVLYKIPLSGAYFTGSNGAWFCWPFFGRGPEGFTVCSRREGDAPLLGLGPVRGHRGQAFVRGGQIHLDR